MKTMNNNNNIENKKNVVVANNAAAEPQGERVGLFEDPNGYDGQVAINEPKGWKIGKVLPFDDAYNHYIKSHVSLNEAVNALASEIGIKENDTSRWAEGLRHMLRGYIEHYLDFLGDAYFFDEVGDPDKCNEAMTDMMIDAIVFESEVVDPYYRFRELVSIRAHKVLDNTRAEVLRGIQEIVASNDETGETGDPGDGDGGILPDEYLDPDDELLIYSKSSETRIFAIYYSGIDISNDVDEAYRYDYDEIGTDKLLQVLDVLIKYEEAKNSK